MQKNGEHGLIKPYNWENMDTDLCTLPSNSRSGLSNQLRMMVVSSLP
jgi:hypothetical protein